MSCITRDAVQTATSSDLLQSAAIVIPTHNASPYWAKLQAALEREVIDPKQVIVIDSSSDDGTAELALAAGYQLIQIGMEDFRHGATRQLVVDATVSTETLIYLTQDALPCGEAPLRELLSVFADSQVGAVYGRQLPRPQADVIERFARLFSYPNVSEVRDFESRKQMGFRAAFFSNSFAAYRRSSLMQVGGFPKDSLVSEEVTVAARLLMAGWKIVYDAEATVIHSHPLTLGAEFSRYFDIGVHHGREPWILETFGTAGGEGLHFVAEQMRYLLAEKPSLIPLATLRNVTKLLSYRAGRLERFLPLALKRRLSGQPQFWTDDEERPSAHTSSNV